MLELEGQILLNVALQSVLLIYQSAMALLYFFHPLGHFFPILLVFSYVDLVLLEVHNLLLILIESVCHEVHAFSVSDQLAFICRNAWLEIIQQIVMSVQLLLEYLIRVRQHLPQFSVLLNGFIVELCDILGELALLLLQVQELVLDVEAGLDLLVLVEETIFELPVLFFLTHLDALDLSFRVNLVLFYLLRHSFE